MLGTYESCQEVARSHQCANCRERGVLVVRHKPSASTAEHPYRGWEVYCPNCGERQQFVRTESLTARWRRDPGSVHVAIANRLERKYGGNPMTDQQLTVISKQEMVERIDGARWAHQLTPAQVLTVAEIAVRYGYDPLMGEVTVYEGKIYVTLDGALRDAKRIPNFQGIQTTPLTEAEREARGIKQPIAYKCELYRADWRVPAVGIGVADPTQPFRNNPVERQQPHALAEARAIRRAVRLAREVPSGIIRERIDPETGEILESVEAAGVQVVSQAAPTDPEPVEHTSAPDSSADVLVVGDTSQVSLCVDCGKDILARQTQKRLWTAADLIAVSKENYGRQLCYGCTINARDARVAEMAERAAQPVAGTPA